MNQTPQTQMPLIGLGQTCAPGGNGLTEEQRRALVECIEAGPVTPLEPDWGAKGDFRKLACFFDANVRQGIQNQTVTGREHVIFRRMNVGGLAAIDVFADADTRSINVGNLSNGKIPPNKAFVMNAIQILVNANATAADLTFGNELAVDANTAVGTQRPIITSTEFPAAIRNGWIKELKVDNTIIWDEMPLLSLFTASSNVYGRPNFFRLAFPILMNAEAEIRLRLEFAAAAPANTNVWVGLYGAITRDQHVRPKG